MAYTVFAVRRHWMDDSAARSRQWRHDAARPKAVDRRQTLRLRRAICADAKVFGVWAQSRGTSGFVRTIRWVGGVSCIGGWAFALLEVRGAPMYCRPAA
jgi:hypothetical protein